MISIANRGRARPAPAGPAPRVRGPRTYRELLEPATRFDAADTDADVLEAQRAARTDAEAVARAQQSIFVDTRDAMAADVRASREASRVFAPFLLPFVARSRSPSRISSACASPADRRAR